MRDNLIWLQADVRVPDGQPLTWQVSADVEALTWSPHAPTTFLVSSEDGLVCGYDARAGASSEPLFRLAAHDTATCALSFNPAAPDLLATASTDNMVRCKVQVAVRGTICLRDGQKARCCGFMTADMTITRL